MIMEVIYNQSWCQFLDTQLFNKMIVLNTDNSSATLLITNFIWRQLTHHYAVLLDPYEVRLVLCVYVRFCYIYKSN